MTYFSSNSFPEDLSQKLPAVTFPICTMMEAGSIVSNVILVIGAALIWGNIF